MSKYNNKIIALETELAIYERNLQNLITSSKEYRDKVKEFQTLTEAQRLLTMLSDKHFNEVIDYISMIINQALTTMFPDDKYKFEIVRKLYRNKAIQLEVKLSEFVDITGEYETINHKMNIGNGMAQLISFLFLLCIYKVTGTRPIIILDEVLNGFHSIALEYVKQIIDVFAKDSGFQFFIIEYSFEDFGQPYLVRKDMNKGFSDVFASDWEAVNEFFELVRENGGSQFNIEVV